MIEIIECPDCNGNGEVLGGTPNVRARMVSHDDLSPDDFGERCPRCLGIGTVEHDLNEDIEGWME